MRSLHSRQLRTGLLLVTLGIGACQSPTALEPAGSPAEPDAPARSAPPAPTREPTREPMRLVPLLDRVPASVRVGWPEHWFRTGPERDWIVPAIVHDAPRSLRIEALSTERGRWYPIELPPWARPRRVALVPRLALGDGPYAELLDLVVELTEPMNGTELHPWGPSRLQVFLPPADPIVDWRGAATEAFGIWNRRLGREVFVTTEDSTVAQIVCTVFENGRKAYAIVEDSGRDGRPVRIRIHLSPRWGEGTEYWIRRVYVHEFGHALGLWGHSDWLGHVMCWRAVIVNEPHPQEVDVARFLLEVPAGFDLSWFDRGGADPAPAGEEDPAVRRGTLPEKPRVDCDAWLDLSAPE